MALLKTADADAVRRRFQNELVDEVTIRFYTASSTGLTVPGWECEYCPATQQLLEEVAALDPRVKLEIHSMAGELDVGHPLPVERVPAVVVAPGGGAAEPNLGARVRFYGIPAGFEFDVLIEDIIAASRRDSGLAPETKAALAGLTADVHLQVFVTPTCPHCPGAGRLAHAMALESPHVRADVIESMEFPSVADRYGVYGVPKVVLNETRSFEGAVPEAAFLAQVLAAAADRSGHAAAPAAR
jgi:glutaredoxin-like protein